MRAWHNKNLCTTRIWHNKHLTQQLARIERQQNPGARSAATILTDFAHARSGLRLLNDTENETAKIHMSITGIMKKHRIYTMSFASVYPHYLAKAEKKGRTKAEVDEIIRWLTGYSQKKLEAQLKKQTDFETFFAEAPQLNSSRALIKGVICGVRVETIKEPTMQEIRYLDKLVDELAKGKAMDKILRK